MNGLVFPCIHIGINTLILRWSHESIVGRVNGVLNPLFVGMMVVAMSVAGALKSSLPLEVIYTGAGSLLLLGVFALIPVFHLIPASAHGMERSVLPDEAAGLQPEGTECPDSGRLQSVSDGRW